MRSEVLFCGLAVAVCLITIGVSAVLVYRAKKEQEKAWREVSDAKSEFLSRITYDIKTPMNAIVGTVALGMEDLDNPERMQECLERIERASNFMMEMLNDLVDMSKIENGRFHLHPKAYAFQDFIEEIREMFMPDCRKKGVEFAIEDEGINVNLMVDPLRFSQIFFNLVSNAVRFTPEGGKITFRVCNYAVHNDTFCADYLVSDNGIGMSREFQQILFEPFTQERAQESGGKNGSGLGLAITRNLVEMMGGTIAVDSAQGKGTMIRVHLELPIAAIQPEKAGAWMRDEQVRRILDGKRILLVEDHPMNTEVTRRILERKGVEVVCAGDGGEALRQFEEHPVGYFDLILMDVYMPGVNGFEATRKIRRVPHSDAQMIPVLALTANDTAETFTACKEAGMNACISKPVEPRHLYQVLCEYLEAPL